MSTTRMITITMNPDDAEELIRMGAKITISDEPKVCASADCYWDSTRLASNNHWVDAGGRKIKLVDMPTSYLLNVRHMLLRKPAPTISLIVTDLESKLDHCHPLSRNNEVIKRAIDKVTSMDLEGLANMVSNSPFFRALNEELSSRGVNVSNLETFYSEV